MLPLACADHLIPAARQQGPISNCIGGGVARGRACRVSRHSLSTYGSRDHGQRHRSKAAQQGSARGGQAGAPEALVTVAPWIAGIAFSGYKVAFRGRWHLPESGGSAAWDRRPRPRQAGGLPASDPALTRPRDQQAASPRQSHISGQGASGPKSTTLVLGFGLTSHLTGAATGYSAGGLGRCCTLHDWTAGGGQPREPSHSWAGRRVIQDAGAAAPDRRRTGSRRGQADPPPPTPRLRADPALTQLGSAPWTRSAGVHLPPVQERPGRTWSRPPLRRPSSTTCLGCWAVPSRAGDPGGGGRSARRRWTPSADRLHHVVITLAPVGPEPACQPARPLPALGLISDRGLRFRLRIPVGRPTFSCRSRAGFPQLPVRGPCC